MAHTAYQQRGGEDSVFSAEIALLEESGHTVEPLLVRNDHIVGLKAKAKAALYILKNPSSVRLMKEKLNSFQPDLVHIHNFFPTLSPAVIEAAVSRGVPVILTMHNYRPLCAGAMLMRNGKPCEDCVGGLKLPGILYRCYRGSVVGSACVGLIGGYLKKLIKRYPDLITLISLTNFAKSRYVADGFPSDNIVVRGNSLSDPKEGLKEREKKIVFVGRLSAEKGAATLLQAVVGQDIELEIIGDGPDREYLESISSKNVNFMGSLPPQKVIESVKKATALTVPSQWYEGFPMVVLEAMATGTPILASRIGSLSEVVDDHENGLLIEPKDVDAWREAMLLVLSSSEKTKKMGTSARQKYLKHYAQDVSLKELETIYKKTLDLAYPDGFEK